jgi:hypothetical protein
MLKPLLISLLGGFFLYPLAAQTGLTGHTTARSLAMGSTGLNYTDANALFSNQAGIAKIKSITAIASAQNRFGIAALNSFSGGAAYPTLAGVFGVSIQNFGYAAYREQAFQLAYGRQLSERISLGGQIGYQQIIIPEYGSIGRLNIAVGLQAELLPKLQMAAYVRNPIRQRLTQKEYTPSVLSVGFAYQPTAQFLLQGEVVKDIDYPVDIRIGFEYHPISAFWFRGGITTAIETWSFGLGFPLLEHFKVDLAAAYHPYLGFSPTISFVYRKKESSKKE